MKTLTFRRQLLFGLILIVLGNFLAFTFRQGIFSNIAWIAYGILFLFNPGCPKQFEYFRGEKKAKCTIRCGGAICIVIGLLTSFKI